MNMNMNMNMRLCLFLLLKGYLKGNVQWLWEVFGLVCNLMYFDLYVS